MTEMKNKVGREKETRQIVDCYSYERNRKIKGEETKIQFYVV